MKEYVAGEVSGQNSEADCERDFPPEIGPAKEAHGKNVNLKWTSPMAHIASIENQKKISIGFTSRLPRQCPSRRPFRLSPSHWRLL